MGEEGGEGWAPDKVRHIILEMGGAMRQTLQMHFQLHSAAAADYKVTFLTLAVPSMILAVAIPMIEAVTPEELQVQADGSPTTWRRTVVILVGVANVCCMGFVYVSGFNCLRDRHAVSAKYYLSLVHDFDTKVLHPGQNCGAPMKESM